MTTTPPSLDPAAESVVLTIQISDPEGTWTDAEGVVVATGVPLAGRDHGAVTAALHEPVRAYLARRELADAHVAAVDPRPPPPVDRVPSLRRADGAELVGEFRVVPGGAYWSRPASGSPAGHSRGEA